MKILKVINNNVVSCMDPSGQEVVAMGRGLGFGAKPGTPLDVSKVEKLFRMESRAGRDRLLELFATLPTEQLKLCSRIVDYAAETLGKRLSETIYLTLTDHICFALSRMSQGMAFQNALLTEVRLFYPQEFAIGRHALELIQQEQGVSLPEDEAASIALHLVNAEYDSSIRETMHVTQALHGILELLDSWPCSRLGKPELYYDELIIHLKFLAMGIFNQVPAPRPEPQFSAAVQALYPQEYACSLAITGYLTRQSGNPVSSETAACLAIHLHRAFQFCESSDHEKKEGI